MQAHGQVKSGARFKVLFANKQVFRLANSLDLQLQKRTFRPAKHQIDSMVIHRRVVQLKTQHGQFHLHVLLIEPPKLLLVQALPLISLHEFASLFVLEPVGLGNRRLQIRQSPRLIGNEVICNQTNP